MRHCFEQPVFSHNERVSGSTMNRIIKRGLWFLSLAVLGSISIGTRPVNAESKYEVFKEASATPGTNIVFIGDSRTVHMYRDCGAAEASRSSWSAKSAMGYSWMVSTGVPKAEAMMKPGDNIVICMGVNSINLSEQSMYPAFVNKKAAEWEKKGIGTYFVSVNPIEDDKKAARNSDKRNSQVIAFNNMMKSKLSDQVVYVDTYSTIVQDFTTLDGTHYPAEINEKIYRLIRDFVMKDSQKRPVTIRFHRNQTAADKASIKQTLYTGSNYPAAVVTWTRKGYKLTGWSTQRDANTAGISLNGAITNSWLKKQKGMVHLYAVWEKVPLSVVITFRRNTNKWDKAYRSQTFHEGKHEKITDKGWKRKGYILTGWSSSPTAAKKGYVLQSTFSDYWIRKNADRFTLYAVWKKKS